MIHAPPGAYFLVREGCTHMIIKKQYKVICDSYCLVAKSCLSLFFFLMSNSFATLWTIAHKSPLSVGFPRQEYWSGLPFPSPGYLPDPGIEPVSPALAGGFFITEPPVKPRVMITNTQMVLCF